jgi:hypothetical protein
VSEFTKDRIEKVKYELTGAIECGDCPLELGKECYEALDEITRQLLLIAELKVDSDRLARDHSFYNDDGKHCVHCGAIGEPRIKHWESCPITLHNSLMSKLDEMDISNNECEEAA